MFAFGLVGLVQFTKMKASFLIFCVCILGSQASPSSRVANGAVATNGQHACMVLVIRPALVGTETGALGSGSIISRRHVLTAGHVVFGPDNNFIINFFVGTSRRSFQSSFALIHENYNDDNYANDIGLIFLQGDNYFSVHNIIRISTANAQAGVAGAVTGYGFTSKQTIGHASVQPMSASQIVTNNCVFKDYEAAPSHFCAIDPITSGIICPGDNGKYFFTRF